MFIALSLITRPDPSREIKELTRKWKALVGHGPNGRILDKKREATAISDISTRLKDSLDRFSVGSKYMVLLTSRAKIYFIQLTGDVVRELLAEKTLEAINLVAANQADVIGEGRNEHLN